MQVNTEVLKQASAALELRRPVRVQFDSDLGADCTGRIVVGDPLVHDVRLGCQARDCCDAHRRLTAGVLAEALLHELRHAWQAEHDSQITSRYQIANMVYGYDGNPYEIDARAWAAENLPRFPGLVTGEDILAVPMGHHRRQAWRRLVAAAR